MSIEKIDVAKRIIQSQKREIEWHTLYEKYLVGQLSNSQINGYSLLYSSYENFSDKDLILMINYAIELLESTQKLTPDDISRLINVDPDRISYIFSNYT